MISFSKQFNAVIYRLLLTGLFILIAFPLGTIAYLQTQSQTKKVPLRNFAAIIGTIDTPIQISIKTSDTEKQFLVSPKQIASWEESYVRNYDNEQDIRFNSGLANYFDSIAQSINKDPIDAKFTVVNGKVQAFTDAQAGERFDPLVAQASFLAALASGSHEVNLTTETVPAQITLDKVNSLGITQLLAEGESNFVRSSTSRIQNIKISSNLYNGLIINPGASFSFNTILGQVDASTGYAPEKVIKDNKIEYDYGGGICQVSTTLFRAATLAGLPILERKNHAFPVHYYDPQGFDATIYPGVSDLRFLNNTPGHLLIQTHITGTKLTFDIYGTSDGRKVTIDGPHQYDLQDDGSMRAYFIRTITFADGSSASQRFTSIYKSPKLFPTEPNPYE